jgi:hypothetical protein
MKGHLSNTLWTLLATLALSPGPTATTANADTIYVCWDSSGDYLTIQEGIDAAQDGDQVVVCDGTYTGSGNKDLDFHGKSITVCSANGPDHCIIDCEGNGRAFYFHSGETAASIVEGFAITNGDVGYFDYGAGICCDESSPTISACAITGNEARRYGGGVYCRASDADLIDCTIVLNTASQCGGGVYCLGGAPTLHNCAITDNHAGQQDEAGVGGGVYSNSRAIIAECRIAGNTAEGHLNSGSAAGLYLDSEETVVDCAITDNWAQWGKDGTPRGGGVLCSGAPTITRCRISANRAYEGAGLYCGGIVILSDCTITGNSADETGGGVYCDYADVTVTNCTFTANWAGDYNGGGALRCYFGNPVITNSILWNDSPNEIGQVGGDPVITYSDVEGGWPGEGNIDSDPLFVDPDGPDDDPNTWEDNDYHLGTGSPCIDVGDPNFVPEPDERDIDGQMRVWDGDDDGEWVVDMGSDEFGSRVPGDLNADDCVDQSDLGILLADWGCTGGECPGDLDFDGDADQADLGILLAHWGEGCP